MENIMVKWKRYAKFLCQYAVERVRGLDFTLPAASEEIQASRDYNGYTKTPEKHMERLLQSLDISYADSRFLDIGCGKGAVLRVASRLPFQKVAGLELDDGLIRTAQRNMKILGLDQVECIHANALDFDRYGEFNVFFLFNPFSYGILSQVLDTLLDTLKENPREIHIIYHHPLHYQLLEKAGLHREGIFYDKLKDYETYIYSNRG